MSRPRDLIREASARLADAGVESPEYDAAELLAHVLGTTRSRLSLVDEVDAEQQAGFEELVVRRAAREPLQHLTGSAAFRHVELQVGPGVFLPRPETELLAGWAIERAVAAGPGAVVVDLCCGSGAIALSVADEVPRAEVHAVELDPAAHAWAERNLATTGVDLQLGDMADAFPELDSGVDVVVCNPPYIPLEAWASRSLRRPATTTRPWRCGPARTASTPSGCSSRPPRDCCGPGAGWAPSTPTSRASPRPRSSLESGRWTEVRDHPDLAGRARYLTARLAR